jgi:hypothetical protein
MILDTVEAIFFLTSSSGHPDRRFDTQQKKCFTSEFIAAAELRKIFSNAFYCFVAAMKVVAG